MGPDAPLLTDGEPNLTERDAAPELLWMLPGRRARSGRAGGAGYGTEASWYQRPLLSPSRRVCGSIAAAIISARRRKPAQPAEPLRWRDSISLCFPCAFRSPEIFPSVPMSLT